MNIENVHPGDFVTPVARLRQEQDFFGNSHEPSFNGIPYEVLAVSPPFLALKDSSGKVAALDVREWSITKVSKKYAAAMRTTQTTRTKKRRRKDAAACPRCGGPLVQRMLGEGDASSYKVHGWFTICMQCGFNGGPVEV